MKLEDLARFVESMEYLQERYDNAHLHLVKNIECLSLSEIKCLFYDDVFLKGDIPTHIQKRLVEIDPLIKHYFPELEENHE